MFNNPKSHALDGIKHLITSDAAKESAAEVRVKAWNLVATGLKSTTKKYSTFLEYIFEDGEILRSASTFVVELFTSRCHEGYRKCATRTMTDLFLSLTEVQDRRERFGSMFHEPRPLDTYNPVGSLLFALSMSSECLPPYESRETRENLVTALQHLSLVTELRSFFAVPLENNVKGDALSAVVVLMAVTKSCETDTETTREAALACLINATVSSSESEDSTGVKAAICSCGGVGILMDIITSKNGDVYPHSLSLHASALLACLVSIPIGKQIIGGVSNGVQLGSRFVEIILNNGHCQRSEVKSNLDGRVASNIIRVLADLKPPPTVDRYFEALLQSLPEPKKDGRGFVTTQSVCLPPDQPTKFAAVHFAAASQTFHCNVLRALISYFDSCPQEGNPTLYTTLTERLVSLLANHSSFHPVVKKNAAAVLARIMKSSKLEMAKVRCRELRGMEILMDLNRNVLI